MNPPIISLQHWLGTAPGRYLLAWEQARLDQAVANLFGFNALQLGLPELQALQANRMPHRWVALPEEALPWSLPTEGLFTGEGRHTVDVDPDVARSRDAGAEDAAVHPAMNLPRVALVADAAALPFPPPAWTWWCCPTRWSSAPIRTRCCARSSACWCPRGGWLSAA